LQIGNRRFGLNRELQTCNALHNRNFGPMAGDKIASGLGICCPARPALTPPAPTKFSSQINRLAPNDSSMARREASSDNWRM
jgi:hypothetical protein